MLQVMVPVAANELQLIKVSSYSSNTIMLKENGISEDPFSVKKKSNMFLLIFIDPAQIQILLSIYHFLILTHLSFALSFPSYIYFL